VARVVNKKAGGKTSRPQKCRLLCSARAVAGKTGPYHYTEAENQITALRVQKMYCHQAQLLLFSFPCTMIEKKSSR
jgi:hypothetical protein